MATPERSLSIAMLIAAAGVGIVALFAFRRRDRPGARGFVVSMTAAALWAVVLSINIWPAQFLPAVVSMTLRNGLILVIVLGWAWLASEYVNRSRITLRPMYAAAILAVPVVTVLITATNPLHHLAYGPSTPTNLGGGPAIEWGPWHLVFMAYAFTVSLVPAAFLVRDLRTAHGVHRRQLLFLLAGFVLAFLGVNDYLLAGALDGVPQYVRISPFVILATGGLWSVALFEHQLFGLVPVSRRTVVETMSDPVIAVDDGDIVVDVNPAASELFGVPSDAAGIALAELCSAAPAVRDAYERETDRRGDSAETDRTEVCIETDGAERHFLMDVEPIRNGHGGAVIVLREVTEQKTYERKLTRQRDDLEILNQLVRHDIRNDLAVIRGHAGLLAEDIDETAHDHLDPIRRSVEHAVELTDTARDLSEAMLRTEAEATAVPLRETVRRQTTEIGAAYPEASVTIAQSLPDVAVAADEMLGEVFRNLLQNAIQHNDKDDPSVTVRADTDRESGTVTVEFADNGPGIPDATKAELFEEGTKRLDSGGSGLGLYLVRSIVDGYGGDISVRDNEPHGSVFAVTLDLAE